MKCIYCLRDTDITFEGVEHVLPQSFGTFGNKTPVLNCVCDECNGYFGRELDQLLARETLEGVSRYSRGIASSETRPQKRLQISLAEGPETGDFAGARVAVDGKSGNLMKLQAQFHVFNFNTEQNEVYFQDQIAGLRLPEDVYGKPASDSSRLTWRAKTLAASKEEHDELVALLHAADINYQPEKNFQLPARDYPKNIKLDLPVEINGEVDSLHKRALTKILLNFVAWTLGSNEALKTRWNCVRSYVRSSEGEIRARIGERPFWNGQEIEERRFADDSIDIRIENLDGNIVGSVQFYSHFTYQMILVEGDTLPDGAEIGYRFTAGSAPIPGYKRNISSPHIAD